MSLSWFRYTHTARSIETRTGSWSLAFEVANIAPGGGIVVGVTKDLSDESPLSSYEHGIRLGNLGSVYSPTGYRRVSTFSRFLGVIPSITSSRYVRTNAYYLHFFEGTWYYTAGSGTTLADDGVTALDGGQLLRKQAESGPISTYRVLVGFREPGDAITCYFWTPLTSAGAHDPTTEGEVELPVRSSAWAFAPSRAVDPADPPSGDPREPGAGGPSDDRFDSVTTLINFEGESGDDPNDASSNPSDVTIEPGSGNTIIPGGAPSDPLFGGVTDLINFEGTPGDDPTNAGNSSSTVTIEPGSGNTIVSTGGVGDSGYFDFSVDDGYVFVGPNLDNAFGAADSWTIDFQVIGDTDGTIFSSTDGNTTFADGVLTIDGVEVLSYTPPANYADWTHVAIVNDGTDIVLYVDGVQQDTAAASGIDLSDGYYLGADPTDPTASYGGGLDEFRITEDERYTAPFDAPTEPAPTQVSGGVGDSGYFDFSVDDGWVFVGPDPDNAFTAADDWTIDFQVRGDTAGTIFSTPDGNTTFADGVLTIDGVEVLSYTPPADYTDWTHVAIVNDGTDIILYVDGTAVDSAPASGIDLSDGFYLGADPTDPTASYGGDLDEFRITADARYTAPFTAPTEPAPTQQTDGSGWEFIPADERAFGNAVMPIVANGVLAAAGESLADFTYAETVLPVVTTGSLQDISVRGTMTMPMQALAFETFSATSVAGSALIPILTGGYTSTRPVDGVRPFFDIAYTASFGRFSLATFFAEVNEVAGASAGLLADMTARVASLLEALTEALPVYSMPVGDAAATSDSSVAASIARIAEALEAADSPEALRKFFANISDGAEASVSVETRALLRTQLFISETALATASTEVKALLRAQLLIAETAVAAAMPQILTAVETGESGTAGDALQVVAALRIAEALISGDGVETYYQALAVVAEAAAALDQLQRAVPVEASETATTAVTALTRIFTELGEAVSAADATQPRLYIAVNESAAGVVGDGAIALGHYLAKVLETGQASVGFRLGDDGFVGWVMNTEGSLAAYEYDNFEFNSFVELEGEIYGANESGLYRLGGTTDDGDPIEASILTLMDDFGTSRQKRLRSAYLGYTTDGDLLLKVKAVDAGELTEHWFRATTEEAAAPREDRVTLALGMRSRYWQFELTNIDGADFELDMLEIHPLVLSRRV